MTAAPSPRDRRIAWPGVTVTQGDVLDAFARHCAEELDDVEVVERDDLLLVARWRSETSRVEIRAGLEGVEALAGGPPTIILTDLEPAGGALVEAFLTDRALRESVAVLDLDRLERLGTVRSSVFVHLEWFLREAYGVRVVPHNDFTRGLLARGIISLGMG